MELKGRDVRVSEDVKNFVKDSEYLVGNFEGTLTDKSCVFMDQRHKEQIIAIFLWHVRLEFFLTYFSPYYT
ncbi:MAG: hypothetical protein R6U96_13360 [Promethearchaeia archaeon]